MSGGIFILYSLGALVLCLAVYGALALFNPPPCNLGIGALL
jgi:hypothetical protein